MKIGQKLILGLVSIALLIEIVGYICLNSSQKALQESIGESSASLAAATLDRIDRGIYSRIEEFQTYSKDLTLQEVTKESNKKFESLDDIQGYIERKDKEWTSVPKETVTDFMQELINNELSEELRNRLKFYEEEYGYAVFGEVFVTNKYGANAAQTGKTTDYRQDDEQWWQNAKTDGLYVTDVGYDESADVYSTDIGIRIEDEAGNFAGVMKVVLNIQEAINVVNETGLTRGHKWHKTMHFKLLTKDGKIIYSTKPGSQSLDNIDVDLFSRFGQVQEAGHKCYFIGKADEPGAEEHLFVHAHSKGYKDFKGLGWILVVEHGTEEIFAPIAKLRKTLLLVPFGATILALVLALFISHFISTPITKLKDAAAEIGAGNFDTNIEIKSNDEIGQLGASFKKMAEDVRKTARSIHKLNKEIAGRKQAEKALQESELIFKTIFENAGGAIFIVDNKTGKILKCNSKAEHLLGRSRTEVIGMHQSELFPKDEEECKERFAAAAHLQERFIVDYEGEVQHKDGMRTPVWVDVQRIKIGSKDMSVGLFIDITERKKAEEAAELAYKKLEEANMELKQVQSQMVQSEKLASIGELAAGVAHEMNNPVGFVASNFETLENYIKKIQSLLETYGELVKQIETSEKTELLNKAHDIDQSRDDMKIDFILGDIQGLLDDSKEGLDRVTNIIQNLRDFSRIDQPGSLDEYNLNDGIGSTLVVARNEIKYDTDIKTDLGELPHISCNSGQINQVFLNILVNAAQAIKSQERDDKGTITIRTYASDDEVVCEISDDGPGIPADKLSKVFDPFFTTKPAGKGTGLGLSVSYDIIVNKHNGKLLSESTVGEGAKFTIKLPINTKIADYKEDGKNGKEKSLICGR
ncbi:Adaptive-response sensory-kinase SasA [subsurface metagenome]